VLIVVRRPRFIARQAEHPSGVLGRVLGAIMAVETRTLNEEVLRHLAVAPGERILEIGFGHGRTLERAAKAAPKARFAGIDHAEDMVAAMSRRARRLVVQDRLELRAGDSSALPWPDATFDGAFAVHTIYFWPDPARHLAEIHRVLRPGGRLVLAFRDRTRDVEASFPPDIYHLRSRDEVLALLTAAGFETTASAGSGQHLWIADARKR
jgi:ubiquinone/menaquinone biosynthesis C-methylase UbiE